MTMHITAALLPLLMASTAITASAEEEKQSPLAKQMEVVSDTYKAVKREERPQAGAAMARDAQQQLLLAFRETPSLIADLTDGPAKDLAMAGYRKMISQSLLVMCQIEEAYLSGKLDAIPKLRDSLKELRSAGHEKFKEAD